jgi:hypothetical protein
VDGDLRLFLDEDGADAERVDQLTDYLRRELGQLDVDGVRRLTSGEAPPGSRGLEIMAVGGLLVTLGRGAQSLASVLTTIRGWLARSPGPVRTVRVELGGDVLELSQATAAEQQRLIELFVSRHAGES